MPGADVDTVRSSCKKRIYIDEITVLQAAEILREAMKKPFQDHATQHYPWLRISICLTLLRFLFGQDLNPSFEFRVPLEVSACC